jgi:hypothetical protein
MGKDSIDFSDAVERDSANTTSSSSGSPTQVRVDMNFGVKEFSSDRDDCIQCNNAMDKVVVVDHGPIGGTKMNREAVPVCNDHVEEVVQAEKDQGNSVKVKV